MKKLSFDEWVARIPLINKMRDAGEKDCEIAKKIGCTEKAVSHAARNLRLNGHDVSPSFSMRAKATADAKSHEIEGRKAEVWQMMESGCSAFAIGQVFDVSACLVKNTAKRIFTTDENAAWRKAQEIRNKGGNTKTTQPTKSPSVPSELQGTLNNSVKSAFHPVTWGAIWGGNPPAPPVRGHLLDGRI